MNQIKNIATVTLLAMLSNQTIGLELESEETLDTPVTFKFEGTLKGLMTMCEEDDNDCTFVLPGQPE